MTEKRLNSRYVHGYDTAEHIRLHDQAGTLAELLHSDTRYPAGCKVLEAGSGVGAQTISIARNSPGAEICCVDISQESLNKAEKRLRALGIKKNVRFWQTDILRMPFAPDFFDHIFVCFVLEHLPRPVEALKKLKWFLKKGGTITVIEGDHGSAYFHPDSKKARLAIQCQVRLQKQAGGNANIGRELFPFLRKAGFPSVKVSPRMVYADASRPEMVKGFIRNTFTAMVKGVRKKALAARMIGAQTFDAGIKDLYRTAAPDGVFCYTFFKAVAEKK